MQLFNRLGRNLLAALTTLVGLPDLVSGEQITKCGLNVDANYPAENWAGCNAIVYNDGDAGKDKDCPATPPQYVDSDWEWLCSQPDDNGLYNGVWCINGVLCCGHTIGRMTFAYNGKDWFWNPCPPPRDSRPPR